MNLLLLERGEIDSDGIARLQDRRAEHLLKVLRVEAGRELRLGVLGEGIGAGCVQTIDGPVVEVRVEAVGESPPRPWIDLIVGLPRPAVLHRVLQTVAAMGVGQLDLTTAWRVEKSFFASPALRPEKIRKHLLLGAEQGMTTRLPEVRQQRLLVPFVEQLGARADPPLRLLAHPRAEEPIEAAFSAPVSRLEIAVGPEGGWIDREVETFRQAGFRPVSLGSWILRVETAVTAVLAQADLLRRTVDARRLDEAPEAVVD
ncbi:MAG: RsmE family RNA methyltransferase [Acidobacteriota bacterium]